MADVAEEVLTADQKEERAKEFFNRGSRNYLVKDYSEAAEDLSRACELYADVYGNESEEIAHVFLYYAKTLIALAQRGENKVLAIEENEGEDGGAGDGAANEDDEDDDDDDDENDVGEQSSAADPQPGTSSDKANGTSHNGTAENGTAGEGGADDEEDITNLQCAWESLEMAVKIFESMGDCALPNLADAYFELGEISLENSQFTEAIGDYERSAAIRLKLTEDNLRVIAETKYKIGLCNLLVGKFDESVTALKESAEFLDGVIQSIKEKGDETTKAATIKELEETKQEIQNKILEVEETKSQSIEDVKREIARLMNPIPQSSQGGSSSSSSGAGGSSSAGASVQEAEKPKATDISHLIKRKKPDTVTDATDGPTSAKKPSLE